MSGARRHSPRSLVVHRDLRRAAALSRKTTLRALIERGLQRELADPSDAPIRPLEQLRQLDSSVWKGTHPDTYVAKLREGWE